MAAAVACWWWWFWWLWWWLAFGGCFETGGCGVQRSVRIGAGGFLPRAFSPAVKPATSPKGSEVELGNDDVSSVRAGGCGDGGRGVSGSGPWVNDGRAGSGRIVSDSPVASRSHCPRSTGGLQCPPTRFELLALFDRRWVARGRSETVSTVGCWGSGRCGAVVVETTAAALAKSEADG
jgi:hypothetical protein